MTARTRFKNMLGKGRNMEEAVNAGAFQFFDLFVMACAALIRVIYLTRSYFLRIQEIENRKLNFQSYRETIEGRKFGSETDIDTVLGSAVHNFNEVIEHAGIVGRIGHAYLMNMDDRSSGIFHAPVRRSRARDLYKLSMEKLSKTSSKMQDDECISFGKDLVSKKVLGKRVIRTEEEQMVEAGEAFGYCDFIGQSYYNAAVMLAVLNIIKMSGFEGLEPYKRTMFEQYIFNKTWDDICTAFHFNKSQFTQIVLDFFPRKMSVCNELARRNRTCLYPTATYFAMAIKGKTQLTKAPKNCALWLSKSTDFFETTDGDSQEQIDMPIYFDERLFIPTVNLIKDQKGRESLKIAGSWYLAERQHDSTVIRLGARLATPLSDMDTIDVVEVNDVLLT